MAPRSRLRVTAGRSGGTAGAGAAARAGRLAAAAAAAQPVQRGTTAHFVVAYDPALGDQGPALADAILGRCEADFGTLQGYFGGVTPAGLPFDVQITTDDTGAYHFGCDGTALYIGGKSATPDNTSFIISLLVAEEDEVFEAAVGNGWDCGASNGEGLSRVLANDMYPGVEPADFVSAPAWLDSDRPNWVDQTEPTDQNYVSIGCAVLFLNWLRFQLGYSWTQVIAAGAPALGQVYTNLTGRTDGFARFSAQLAANYPPGQPSGLTVDQPYPLPGLDAGPGNGSGTGGTADGGS